MRSHLTLFGSMLLLCAPLAQAAEDERTEAPPPEKTVLESITVTANKLEENAREIPASIQVITGEQLEQSGIYSLEPLLRRLPNTTVSNNYGVFASPSYRGLTTSAFTQESAITIYIDGVPHSSVYGMDLGLLNIERVEVLRGAQSTLYGQNSMGGVINIITRQESGAPRGQLGAELAEYGGRFATASFSGDLIDETLSLTLSARYRHSNGYLENRFPGVDKNYDKINSAQYKGSLLWRLSGQTHAVLSFNNENKNNGGIPLYAGRDFRRHTRQEVETWNKVALDEQSLKVEHDFGPFITTYLGTNQRTDARHQSDMDRTNGSFSPNIGSLDGARFIDHSIVSNRSHELRFAGQKALRWVAGLYYQNNLYDALDNGSVVPNSLFGHMQAHNMTDVRGKQVAAFGQLTVPLGSRLESTIGLRWQRDDKRIDYKDHVIIGGMETRTSYSRGDRWDIWLPKFSLGYTQENGTLWYAGVSRGYQSGGFNFTETSADKARFSPQKTADYSLGVKSAWLGNRLWLDLNLFYLDIKDAHGRSISALNSIQVFNVKQAYSHGAEADISWLFGGGWRLNGTFGINRTRYASGVFGGKQMTNAPRFTTALGMSYDQGYGLYGVMDYRYRTASYTDAANTLKIDSHGVFDGRLGYRLQGYDVYLYGENLFNQKYATNLYSLPFSGTQTIMSAGRPRTLGIGITAYF
ncbi:hypothetical protein EBB59_04965 [Lysobacter pythonis]|uniref:TonB-dependent receptor n=1 Tax=Solilutibacter pythonis TaxID=2483112 RepID=A0A3M2I5Q2_9GAMM|nr:TonB-dependent receptor [Lysobacter pythonis]RMH93594.1 hypothetical protein EBB59_04965 [Lysobacter pythonis]